MGIFADRVREARQRARHATGARWTQGDLARAVGVQRNTVSRWENEGVHPKDPSLVAKIAEVLHVRVEWLLGADSPAIPAGGAIRALDKARLSYGPPSEALERLPTPLYDVVIRYLDRLSAAGCSQAQISAAERILVDGAFNGVSSRPAEERSAADMVADIDAAWDFVTRVLRREGKRP